MMKRSLRVRPLTLPQVSRMHQIYRHANQTFVHLGNPPEGIDLALNVLRRACRDSQEGRKAQVGPGTPPRGPIEQYRPPMTQVSVEEALALSQFAELVWFKRTWTVQEVCLWDIHAAFPPLFLCGDHQIQW